MSDFQTRTYGNPSGTEAAIIDSVSHVLTVIPIEHMEIHANQMFAWSEKFSIAEAGVANLVLTTPAVGYVHFKPPRIDSNGPDITVELVEGQATTVGTARTPLNRNRNSSVTSDSTLVSGATLGAGGSTIDTMFIGGGTGVGGTKTGAQTSNENEWVLLQNTKYVVKITNGGSGTAIVCIGLLWYESA